jgi:hypothetical protein
VKITMCIYIILIINKSREKSFREVIQKEGFAISSFRNDSVEKFLSEKCLFHTSHSCDCKTALGQLARDDYYEHSSFDKEKEKRQKKGWTQAKINRAIYQIEKSASQKEMKRNVETQRELEEWQSILKAVISQRFEWFGLLIHSFDKTLELEEIVEPPVLSIKEAQLTTSFLAELKTDVLYRFL